MLIKPETTTHGIFHGLVLEDGRPFSNWGLSRTTRPAVYIEPVSYADVQTAVRDTDRFPSPIHPVGSMHSVTSTVVNDGGTMVSTSKLDEIIGLEEDATGRQVVRVQAGCRLAKLNRWLQARNVEIRFQSEIGEATVGSLAVADSKESSLDGPGYFSADVVGVTYVDEHGELRHLSDHVDGAAFHEFKCSFGLSGIVVECLLEVRPATLCRTDTSIHAFGSPEDLAAGLLDAREQSDSLFAIVFLHDLAAFYEQHYRAGLGAFTPDSSQPGCEEYRAAKRLAIQRGFDGVAPPQPSGLIHSRADFVNEYWHPTADESRIDFQYYEHDLSQLPRVLVESFQFTNAFQARTGFAPKGWATFFVNRPDTAKKPFGVYSAGPGVSFSFDPTGEKAREVKARYRGVCRGCGAPTSARNGKGDAYPYCKRCHPGAIERQWTRERVREAMRAWHARYHSQPTSYDWSVSHAIRRGPDAVDRLQDTEWPAASTVSEVYGTWASARADAFSDA